MTSQYGIRDIDRRHLADHLPTNGWRKLCTEVEEDTFATSIRWILKNGKLTAYWPTASPSRQTVDKAQERVCQIFAKFSFVAPAKILVERNDKTYNRIFYLAPRVERTPSFATTTDVDSSINDIIDALPPPPPTKSSCRKDKQKEAKRSKELTEDLVRLTTTTNGDEHDQTRPPPNTALRGLSPDTNEKIEIKLSEDRTYGKCLDASFGISKFHDLAFQTDVAKGISRMGFSRPSGIQKLALPLIILKPQKSLVPHSTSRSGKTCAAAISIIDRVHAKINAPQVLYLTSSEAAAESTMQVIENICTYTSVVTQFALPRTLERGDVMGGQIVVGTAGTVLKLIKKARFGLDSVSIFVLDEADNMLDQPETLHAYIEISKVVPKTCQRILITSDFSTLFRAFADRIAPDANMISLRQEELSVEGIKQFYMDCKNEEHKVEVLIAIYGLLTVGQSIVFVRQRDVADALAHRMQAKGHECLVLTGKYDETDRDKAMADFRDGRKKVLITTQTVDRTLDIGEVDILFTMDFPLDRKSRPDYKAYLRRIGRTGRFGRTGVSINFVHDQKSYADLKAIEKQFGQDISQLRIKDLGVVGTILTLSMDIECLAGSARTAADTAPAAESVDGARHQFGATISGSRPVKAQDVTAAFEHATSTLPFWKPGLPPPDGNKVPGASGVKLMKEQGWKEGEPLEKEGRGDKVPVSERTDRKPKGDVRGVHWGD
ncbi:RNA helicase required for poly(A+) mRNA export [Rhizophlyctis rosea]|nr:RNA helicase required for poly(A+) mRNA export [Rhizophlyctis rosea]